MKQIIIPFYLQDINLNNEFKTSVQILCSRYVTEVTTFVSYTNNKLLGNCRKGSNCPFPHVNANNRNGYNNNRSNFGQIDIRRRLNDYWDASTLDRKSAEVAEELREFDNFESMSFSSFGLADPAVENLISGRDYSYEESRLDFYQAQQSNTIPEYEKMINVRTQDMRTCIDHLKNDTRKAARYTQITTKEKFENPNTYAAKPFINTPLDLTGNSLASSTQSPFGSGPFGATNTNSNPFNSPSTNPFGSSSTSSGVFGNQNSKPSVFGGSNLPQNSSSTPFGQSSQGNSSGGAFGSQSLGGSSAFGQSGFGASSANTSPFGSKLPGTSNIGNSAFGSSGFGSSGFGSSGFSSAPTNKPTTTTSPFGSSTFGSKPAESSAFGTSGLGSNSGGAFGSSLSGNGTSSSAFGSSGFGQPAASTSPFGQQKSSSTSGFGSSGFGSSATSASPFGSMGMSSTSNTEKSSPFGQPATASQSPFGQINQGSTASPFGQSAAASAGSSFGASGFGQTNGTQSPFGQIQQTNGSSSVPTGGNFGMAFQQSSSVSGQGFSPTFKQSAKEEPRVEENQLGDEVKNQFIAGDFTIGLVPEVPPPLLYC